MSLVIQNGWLVDPVSKKEGRGHLWAEGGRIQKIAFDISAEAFMAVTGLQEMSSVQLIDAGGRWVIPGLVDLHVHFRDPGQTHKEDIASGCQAAAKGGVTTVCCMPNTKPVIDSRQTVVYIQKAAAAACGVRVWPVGAITRRQEGRELSDIEGMLEAGAADRQTGAGFARPQGEPAVHAACMNAGPEQMDGFQMTPKQANGFQAMPEQMDGMRKVTRHMNGGTMRGICALSEDGKTVMDEALMLAAMQRAAACALPVFSHTEDHRLSGGAMHECALSRRLGIPGIPAAAEENIAARDIALAAETGCRLHICHVSTAGSVELIRAARQKGAAVTAEAAPHHFTLRFDDLLLPDGRLDANKKMAPPLRSDEDVKALRQAIKDGVISVIATDHAPHQAHEKEMGFEIAPFGVTGLETSFAVSYTELVRTGLLTPVELIERMCLAPAAILGLEAGSLCRGALADIAIVDINKGWTVKREETVSKSQNTPFDGKNVWGKVWMTIAGGRVIYDGSHSQESFD